MLSEAGISMIVPETLTALYPHRDACVAGAHIVPMLFERVTFSRVKIKNRIRRVRFCAEVFSNNKPPA